MKTSQLRQFTDQDEKVTRERADHPGIEPRATRKHPASGLRRAPQRNQRAPQEARR